MNAGFSAKKQFVQLKGKPVWLYSAELFAGIPQVVQIIMVAAPEDLPGIRTAFSGDIERLGVELVAGGAERFLSVENGLAAVRTDADFVAIHDAARPCVTLKTILATFQAAEKSGAAIPAVPIVGTVKRSMGAVPETASMSKGMVWIEGTQSRERLWEAQTPQVFQKNLYISAVNGRGNLAPTDDAGLMEHMGFGVRIVEGERTNIKVTTAFDLRLAEKYLELNESPHGEQ